jgi:S-adenosylmethionine:tRNA ribosyltransferase-isomerase
MPIQDFQISDFDYVLPDSQIAQYPLAERDRSRLLISKNGNISESLFSHLADFLPGHSLLVWNNTRVIHARLPFRKESGAAIEIFCLEPVTPIKEISLALQAGPGCEWDCLVGNAKKWKKGLLSLEFEYQEVKMMLTAERISEANGVFRIRFHWENDQVPWATVLDAVGKVPLPPYISREAEQSDGIRYQTVYAQNKGSVAAPTAGLHFTEEVILSLKTKDISHANLTLHVGAGTFKPVTSPMVSAHEMHTEQFVVERSVIQKLAQAGSDVIAVGTTSLRTLESLYWAGVKILCRKPTLITRLEQWEAYDANLRQDVPAKESWAALLDHLDAQNLAVFAGETRLMITPSYRIRTTDILITNFHQPRSTLLLLVAAFAGDDWRKAYAYALKNGFRFLSYGDACLFFASR